MLSFHKSKLEILGLNITSTILRALMTTECHDAFLDGKISDREKGVDKLLSSS